MEPTVVVIYVWRGKAYLPTQAQYETGGNIDVNPVYVANLRATELAEAMGKVLAAKQPILSALTKEEIGHRTSPVLVATGARSWKVLAQTGASYVIGWNGKEVRIDMSRLDKKGRWEYDLDKTKLLPPDTSLTSIAETVMDDIQSRLEVLT